MNDDIIIIERFSKKRYETYKAKGIPFHVVNGKGRLCEVKAFDCGNNHDQVFVEYAYKLALDLLKDKDGIYNIKEYFLK